MDTTNSNNHQPQGIIKQTNFELAFQKVCSEQEQEKERQGVIKAEREKLVEAERQALHQQDVHNFLSQRLPELLSVAYNIPVFTWSELCSKYTAGELVSLVDNLPKTPCLSISMEVSFFSVPLLFFKYLFCLFLLHRIGGAQVLHDGILRIRHGLTEGIGKGARAIMGTNFFGVEKAIDHFWVIPSEQQLADLALVPFTEEVLKSCKDTHILVATFPMSILDIRGKVKRELFFRHDDAWYNKQAFAKDKGEVGWQLVRKVPIADSMNKTWNEQQALLSQDEVTPSAQVVVYTIIGHFLACGERLFENIFVCCSKDLGPGGYRVSVGYFDTKGLNVDYWDDDTRHGNVGLSAARKKCS